MIWLWLFAIGIVLLLYLAVKVVSGSEKSREDNKEKMIPLGNLSCFMDQKGNVHIIPFAVDIYKRGKASGLPLVIEVPFTCSEFGEMIRKGLCISASGKIVESAELMKSLGFYDWKDYSEGKKSVSVTCREQEVVLNSTIRRSDGSYVFRVPGYEKTLPRKLSDHALGNAVMELMKLSRSLTVSTTVFLATEAFA